MSLFDWVVLGSFLAFVVLYGMWKTRGKKNIQDFLLANKTTPWYTVTLSIMATQASAITFLSTPGQAYVDGMRFVQFYLGLPLAMIILSVTAVPLFHNLKVYTAYEYLEQRFDLKNRLLGSVLFLIQRGLAAGFTILAPSLIVSILLGWDVQLTVLITGILVVLYTASGGTDAVNKTHLMQMLIITVGMGTAFFMIIYSLPKDISFLDATKIAGKMGKLNAITFDFDWKDRYNFWTGLIGGTFLALSYFGTDQSQVQRYLSGKSIAQSRIGLLANGVIKIPMQFGILFLGAMVFVFYQFALPPLFFNSVETTNVKKSAYASEYQILENKYEVIHNEKQAKIREMLDADKKNDKIKFSEAAESVNRSKKNALEIRKEAAGLIKKANPGADTNDTNFIFLTFVVNILPAGLIGLILAAIFSASMSSTSAELNALASTTVVDIYKRMIKPEGTERHYVMVSKLSTIFWGFYAISFALFANRMGSLIEAVNILGSLFYGTILGIFLIAFYFKKIGGSATFYSALAAELVVIGCFFFTDIPYLWYNVIGCVLLILLAHLVHPFVKKLSRPL
ncbi:MAG: sodium:solute symporter [Ignavibacteria bacterium CG_4_8_14_3_um_filter_37_9]|nr:sodium:solute symporter [Ignavibacteria bacterium]OIO18748.1 MAG: sodium:solute symporter [Ignavibacteria bacterium CG1_02_37_35]PIW98465.1 MAG: sodium:solute symporter [Ignavibacteria bacterium CG_4_8_14_3_um_filter_37_9]